MNVNTASGGIDILVEEGHSGGLASLERHWLGQRTFLYIHEKSLGVAPWLNRISSLIPTAYREKHFCLLTSGSTGKPKLVIGRKDNAERLAAVLHNVQESEPVLETIVALPLTYCYAFVNQWLWSRVARRKLIMTAGLARPETLRAALLACERAMLCLVGSQAALLRGLFGDESFPGVIRLHFAGGRFPQEQLPALRLMFPNAVVFNNYGCAEALPRLTVRRAEDADSATDIGFPLPGIELKTGENDELLFRSPYRCVAQLEESDFRAFSPDSWTPNGDLARVGTEGHWHLLAPRVKYLSVTAKKWRCNRFSQPSANGGRGKPPTIAKATEPGKMATYFSYPHSLTSPRCAGC